MHEDVECEFRPRVSLFLSQPQSRACRWRLRRCRAIPIVHSRCRLAIFRQEKHSIVRR
jgi:hypothetical protein